MCELSHFRFATSGPISQTWTKRRGFPMRANEDQQVIALFDGERIAPGYGAAAVTYRLPLRLGSGSLLPSRQH